MHPESVDERNLALALELLGADRSNVVTLGALRDRGVRAPADAMYTLQLAGYEIDRVFCEDADGRRRLGYRLHGATVGGGSQPAAPRRPAADPPLPGDGIGRDRPAQLTERQARAAGP